MIKTLENIINSIVSEIKSTIGRIDTRVGTVIRDAIIAPIASVISDLYAALDVVYKNQSVDTTTGETALDALAANFGLSRVNAIPTTGRVRFYVSSIPLSEVIIPASTDVYPTFNSSIIFKTLNSVIISSVTLPQESNEDSPFYQYYYVEADVQCQTVGIVGNVAEGSLRVTNFVNVNGVDNAYDFENGKDTQTDAELIEVIRSTARGNIGTIYGYDSLMRSNFNLRDVQIISFDDEEADRTYLASAVDIILLDDYIASVTEVVVASSTIYFSSLPVHSVDSVIYDDGVTQTTLVLGVDYSVSYDMTSIYRKSVKENSYITIINPAYQSGGNITIGYNTYSNVSPAQSLVDSYENKILGSSVLVKAAININTGITLKFKVFPSYDFDTVKQSMEDAIKEYFSSLKLTEQVQKSDIIDKAYVEGVDYIDLPNLDFYIVKEGQPNESVDIVEVKKNEYIKLDSNEIYLTQVGV